AIWKTRSARSTTMRGCFVRISMSQLGDDLAGPLGQLADDIEGTCDVLEEERMKLSRALHPRRPRGNDCGNMA
ncbi:MAG: hypothetical protein WB820_23195, partial [Rhodoplanes sp.]